MVSTRSEHEIGAAARQARAAALDSWLAGLLPVAPAAGVALVAVGGLGRRECAPYGDLDLILLHNGVAGVGELAAGIWYPIWDTGRTLDHSTRTVPESLDAAHNDVKVALGLLDVRHLAGDRALTTQLASAAVQLWRRTATRQLGRLRELCEQRYAQHGELAYLLEGDLKEAAGGLRDVGVLRGIGLAGIADAVPPPVRAAATRLLDCRDALHLATGRRVDRLRAQERDAVTQLLDLADGEALLRRIGLDARTISWTLADAWRATQRWREGRRGSRRASVRQPIARDVIAVDGEVVLARTAVASRPDPTLSLRVAAAAARAQLPIARATLDWLARFSRPLPVPWPHPARSALLALLGAGPGLVPTWESCDRFGLTGMWLPEWTRLRGTPQYHPVHQYTLDRHLVQTAAHAARWAREVNRPDLLMLGALLHDVGKGLAGDHAKAGVPIAAEIASMIGLPPSDVEVLTRVVRHHLLLPDVATRRDLADPGVVDDVVKKVTDAGTLEILHMLARADAAATGPAAWSTWKSRLIDELVDRVAAVLGGAGHPPVPSPDPALRAGELPVIQIAGDGDWVALAARDRPGLLAAVAGCLAAHRLEIVAVNSVTTAGRAIIECAVTARLGPAPPGELVLADLHRVALDQFTPPPRIGRAKAAGQDPRVLWVAPDLLELRATDMPALLYRVTSAFADNGAGVRAARVSTLGADVVDAFYLTGNYDQKAVTAAVLAAAAGA